MQNPSTWVSFPYSTIFIQFPPSIFNAHKTLTPPKGLHLSPGRKSWIFECDEPSAPQITLWMNSLNCWNTLTPTAQTGCSSSLLASSWYNKRHPHTTSDEVLKMGKMWLLVLWAVTALKIEALCSSETLVPTYKSALRHYSENKHRQPTPHTASVNDVNSLQADGEVPKQNLLITESKSTERYPLHTGLHVIRADINIWRISRHFACTTQITSEISDIYVHYIDCYSEERICFPLPSLFFRPFVSTLFVTVPRNYFVDGPDYFSVVCDRRVPFLINWETARQLWRVNRSCG